jgi:hypothetical protein
VSEFHHTHFSQKAELHTNRSHFFAPPPPPYLPNSSNSQSQAQPYFDSLINFQGYWVHPFFFFGKYGWLQFIPLVQPQLSLSIAALLEHLLGPVQSSRALFVFT